MLHMDTTYINRANTNAVIIGKINAILKDEGTEKEITLFSTAYKQQRAKLYERIVGNRDGPEVKGITLKDNSIDPISFGIRRAGPPKNRWAIEAAKDYWQFILPDVPFQDQHRTLCFTNPKTKEHILNFAQHGYVAELLSTKHRYNKTRPKRPAAAGTQTPPAKHHKIIKLSSAQITAATHNYTTAPALMPIQHPNLRNRPLVQPTASSSSTSYSRITSTSTPFNANRPVYQATSNITAQHIDPQTSTANSSTTIRTTPPQATFVQSINPHAHNPFLAP